jgi:hypothetical protein
VGKSQNPGVVSLGLRFPFLFGDGDPFSLSFKHHFPFKGCDCSEHGEHKLTSRSGGIQVDVENLEAHSLILKLIDDLKKVFSTSGANSGVGSCLITF